MLRFIFLIIAAQASQHFRSNSINNSCISSCSEQEEIEIRSLGSVLGAEVIGLDLSSCLSITNLDIIKTAFAEHLVLVFRNQLITPAQQVNFTANWGAVDPHPLGSRANTRPRDVPEEVMVIQNNPVVKVRGLKNDFWHSDISFMEYPPSVSVLYALDVPEGYGDTMFANGYLGYQELSDGFKELLRSLRGIHNSKWFELNRDKDSFSANVPDVIHPIVRTHPVTGNQSLFVTEYMERFKDMSVEESEPVKKFLISWISRPENVYRHKWTKGDLVMWDNRATLHYGVFDYPPEMTRIMHRTTAAGERPV